MVRRTRGADDCDTDISLVANNRDNQYTARTAPSRTSTAERADADEDRERRRNGATTGAVPGGGAGLLAGLGMLAIPGVGPVVAAVAA